MLPFLFGQFSNLISKGNDIEQTRRSFADNDLGDIQMDPNQLLRWKLQELWPRQLQCRQFAGAPATHCIILSIFGQFRNQDWVLQELWFRPPQFGPFSGLDSLDRDWNWYWVLQELRHYWNGNWILQELCFWFRQLQFRQFLQTG